MGYVGEIIKAKKAYTSMKKIIVVAIAFLLLPIVISSEKSFMPSETKRQEATPVIASKENPFYALIATPVALYYDDGMHVKPLLVENISNPSDAVERFKQLYGLQNAIVIAGKSPAEASNEIALQIWNRVDEAVIISNDFDGYSLGIALASLASYKNIPVFVADNIDEIENTLKSLGVKKTYVCGNIEGYGNVVKFESIEEINDFMISFLKQKFGKVDYIVMTNPLDVQKPEVLDSVEYHFEGEINSGSTLHGLNILLSGFNYTALHEFYVPFDGFARIRVELINKDSDEVEKWGDRLFLHLATPDNITFVYASTAGGIPVVQDGEIIVDRLTYQTCVYNKPGVYKAEVVGTWMAKKKGRYEMNVIIEKVDRGNFPLMEGLSSMASYLAAYHHGIVFASPQFSFAGGENANMEGIIYPVTNENLVEPCNEHVFSIHSHLNELLAKIADLPADVQALWQYYKENPSYIAILADATMIPMFYYYNPDSDFISGQGTASDFIYGDIDPDPEDTENDTFTYYPFQENAVGRITGYDVEDCSALIARTIFYNEIIEGEWKRNATVQTGCGLEFQWIPVVTTLANLVLGGNEPTKWPTGESYFMNLRLCNDLEQKGYNVKRTHLLASQREGFENLAKYGRKYFLFPRFYEAISGDNVKGGEYQQESSIIFTFNHGFYYLYESGDILLEARGFPPFTTISRFYPMGSGLSSKGTYDVRNVYKMNFGPSVVYIESCIVGRTDGLQPENCLSQAYLHAGVNAFVAASRVTADPGYLEPGLIFEGFGIWGFINATMNLKKNGEYPEPHFGAVIAEDFILDLIHNDSTTGIALRNAKNKYLPKDANSTFMWTPPLISTGCKLIDEMLYESMNPRFEYGKYLDKKYHCLHEFNLYGDPAFNPWNP